MAVSPGDVIRVVAKMAQAGQEIQNVYELFHGGSSSVTEAALLSDIADWLNVAYGFIVGRQSTAHTYESIEAANVTQNTPVGEIAWPTRTAGTDASSNPVPLQIAGLIRFPSNYLGSQGRKFIAGLTENMIDGNGILTAATQTDLATMAASLLGGVTSGTESFTFGKDNPAKSRYASFLSAIVNDVVATQRRRKQGVGI